MEDEEDGVSKRTLAELEGKLNDKWTLPVSVLDLIFCFVHLTDGDHTAHSSDIQVFGIIHTLPVLLMALLYWWHFYIDDTLPHVLLMTPYHINSLCVCVAVHSHKQDKNLNNA